ncbi:hypothetical protein [Sphingomonas sp.]|uniref:hypothetical protein n=1 Tax=Sphingomonas sp. TaxID=28214 RepID=UPI002C45C19D|nr:hypothetical protein [Sphingomonas sp.]HTG37275.1 hypothetical protein [Sphingomonas sp.]
MSQVDEQIARASEALERARTRRTSVSQRSRRRREGTIVRRVGAIALADGVIIALALVIGSFVPLGMVGALIVMALLVATTLAIAFARTDTAPTPEKLAEAPIKALPLQTEQWLEGQRLALPAPARTLVDSIGVKLETLAPQLERIDDQEPAAAEVRKLVAEQLPELVNSYRRVPEPLRGTERNGQTPDAQLVEGLRVIDQEIATMTAQLAQGDLDLLATRGRYLQIRYQGDEGV